MNKKKLISVDEVDKIIDFTLLDLADEDNESIACCSNMEESYIPYIDDDGNTRAVYEVLTCKDCGEQFVTSFYTDGSYIMEFIANNLGYRDCDQK